MKVSKFHTSPCPCKSGLNLGACCGPLLAADGVAQTPEQLMRSRYTAFARRNNLYLLKTWHASTRPGFEQLETRGAWVHLKVLESVTSDTKTKGNVEFVAKHLSQNTLSVLHEKSEFLNENGTWYYLNGTIVENSQRSMLEAKEQECPCGSGKKFKKCHFENY
jgi:SEC-C motif domain protein